MSSAPGTWTTASCWRPTTLRPTPTPPLPRPRCSVTLICCRSACEPLPVRPGQPAQPRVRVFNRTGGRHAAEARIPGAPRIPFEQVDIAKMIMTTTFSHRLWPLILGCAAALILTSYGSPLHAQTVAVMVNGEPITNYDIDQRTKLTFMTTHKPPSRQQVIDELIDEKVKIREAKKFGVDPTTSDIDQAYAGMSARMRITPEQLSKSLESQGVRPETLKERIKTDMVWSSLVRGRFKESLQVGEKGVVGAVKEDEKPETESFEYKMQ